MLLMQPLQILHNGTTTRCFQTLPRHFLLQRNNSNSHFAKAHKRGWKKKKKKKKGEKKICRPLRASHSICFLFGGHHWWGHSLPQVSP